MVQDQSRVIACTTSRFDGLIAMIHPESSWVAKWNRIGESSFKRRNSYIVYHSVSFLLLILLTFIIAEKRVPGLYAVKTSGQLPEELREKMR